MAGKAPPFSLDHSNLQSSRQYCKSFTYRQKGRHEESSMSTNCPAIDKLRTPTLHVHGLQDAGLGLLRNLLRDSMSPTHAISLIGIELIGYHSRA